MKSMFTKNTFVRVGIATFFAVYFAASFKVGLSSSAWANGRGFFEDLDDDDADAGPPFFGFVKDTSGKFLADASVTVTIKAMNSTLAVRTDIQGHYRVPGFSKEIDPKTIDITCSKDGYKLVDLMRRPPVGDGPIEVSCTLAKV
jgi:hypothetical protein